MAFQKIEKTEEKKVFEKQGDWEVVGWINTTKNAGTFTVKDKDNDLLGFVTATSLKKIMEGESKGVPISLPKGFKK